jgi:hypothetical protein
LPFRDCVDGLLHGQQSRCALDPNRSALGQRIFRRTL